MVILLNQYWNLFLRSRIVRELLDFFLIFGGVFLLGIIILNFKELQYERNDYINSDSILESQQTQEAVEDISISPWVKTLENITTTFSIGKSIPVYDYRLDEYLQSRVDNYHLALNMFPPDNRLIITSLGVNAHIVDVKYASEKKLKTADFKNELKQGIVKYPFTPDPGLQEKGSSLFFGHSSVDLRDSDNVYGYIFRKLAKIANGEEVKIIRKGKMYTYVVDKKEVVSPTEVGNTLNTYNDATYATLMACYPLYTSTNRMLVRARLIDNHKEQFAMKR